MQRCPDFTPGNTTRESSRYVFSNKRVTYTPASCVCLEYTIGDMYKYSYNRNNIAGEILQGSQKFTRTIEHKRRKGTRKIDNVETLK